MSMILNISFDYILLQQIFELRLSVSIYGIWGPIQGDSVYHIPQ
jgi:hypothetical protein